VVKDWVEKNNPCFEDLQKAFPDEVQGAKGTRVQNVLKEGMGIFP
jgi:hypothetical protein